MRSEAAHAAQIAPNDGQRGTLPPTHRVHQQEEGGLKALPLSDYRFGFLAVVGYEVRDEVLNVRPIHSEDSTSARTVWIESK